MWFDSIIFHSKVNVKHTHTRQHRYSFSSSSTRRLFRRTKRNARRICAKCSVQTNTNARPEKCSYSNSTTAKQHTTYTKDSWLLDVYTSLFMETHTTKQQCDDEAQSESRNMYIYESYTISMRENSQEIRFGFPFICSITSFIV